ncbi:MAG: hypothetical protein UHS49_00090 [Faecalimonas sp.]|nr:hypothetical protein [Faecalimonas sp.]
MKKMFEGKKRWLVAVVAVLVLALVGVGSFAAVSTLTGKSTTTNGGDGTFVTTRTDLDALPTDYKEVRPEDLFTDGNAANQMNPMTGGADEAAEAMRTAILSTKDNLSISGTKYYVSTSGSTNNDGKSEKYPIPISQVNTLSLKSGDAVLFERGGVFRITDPIKAVSGVTYGAYGEGDKPCIYGSPQNFADPSKWKPTNKANVWKLNTGNYMDIGSVIFNHGQAVGIKMPSGLDQLKKTGDFYHNDTNQFIYLYCAEGNPGNVYKDIEFAVKGSIFILDVGKSDITFDNLCLKYIGEFGINGVGANNDITVTNCEMGYIGGTKLSLTVRYGNAIQFWSTCQRVTVENCWFYQVFDVAVTFQGDDDNVTYSDISFSNNLFEYNDMDIEMWNKPGAATIQNITMNDNIMRFNSYGWGTRIEDAGNRGGAANFKIDFSNASSTYSNITVKNNIMDCSRYTAVYWLGSSRNSATISGNSIYALSNREVGTAMMRYEDNQQLMATDQSSLETAFKTFDKNSNTIQWID